MLMKKKKPQIIISENYKIQESVNKNNEIIEVENFDDLKKKTLKKQEHKMTEEEKELNRKILKNMNRKQNFVKNPRFRNTAKFMLYSNALFSDILGNENPFVVEPIIVTFREYQLNCVYQIDLKLTNRKQILTSFKYIPPSTENFSIKKIIYPKKDTSLIAPGMHAKLEILFNATSLDSFEDELSIITETFAFTVPLRAIRELPALSLDNPMVCGKCLLGDQTSMVFRCKNNGGDAHFKFTATEDLANHSTLNFNSKNIDEKNSQDQENEVLFVGPFSIFPQEFYLYKGMSIEIYVNFNPKTEGNIEKNLVICCDSKINLNHKIIGEGITVDFKITALDGLIIDETVEKLENLFFEDSYPSISTSRNLRIKNLSSIPLRYHWSIYDMYENDNFSIQNEEDFFLISPEEGIFEAYQEITFTVNFKPRNCKNYEQKLDLIIEDVPFQSIKNFQQKENVNTIKKNHFTKGEPFMLALNSPYPSYPIFSFNLKGKGKQCYLDIKSKIIDLGIVYIGEKITNYFELLNPKSGLIKFKIPNILQSIKKNVYLFDSDPVIKVNNFFKWSEPGSTVTDHFRTTCIFKLKKQDEETFDKVISRINKETNIGNNIDNIIDMDSHITKNKISNFSVSEKIENIFSSQNNNNHNNNSHFVNYLNIEKSGNGLLEEVKFLKLTTLKENLYRKELEISKIIKTKKRRKTKNYYNDKNKNSFNGSISIDNNSSFTTNNNLNKDNSSVDSKKDNFQKKNNLIEKFNKTNLNIIKTNKNFENPNKTNPNFIGKMNSINTKVPILSLSKTKTNNLKPLGGYIQNKNLNLQNSLIIDDNSIQNKTTFKNNNNLKTDPVKNNLTQSSKSILKTNIEEIEIDDTVELMIKKDQTLNINVEFLPNKLGFFKSSVIINPEDGIPFSVDFKAKVIGPGIIINTPCIDFGLFSVNEIRTEKIRLKNISRAPARFLIKEIRYKNINFENYIDSEYITENEGIINELKPRKKIENLIDYQNIKMREMDTNITDNYEIKFSPIFGTIEENKEIEITVL